MHIGFCKLPSPPKLDHLRPMAYDFDGQTKLPRRCLMRTLGACVPSALLVLSLGLYLPANLRGQGRLPSTSESSERILALRGSIRSG